MQLFKQLFTIFLLFITCFVFAQTSSLQTKISISLNDVSVSTALDEIEQIAAVTFTYNSNIIDKERIVSINMFEQPLLDVLQELLGKEYSFRLIKNQVLIFIPLKKDDKPIRKSLYFEENKTQKEEIPGYIDVYFDTVVVVDTLRKIHIDTLRRTIIDSIRVYDTISILKTKMLRKKYSFSILLDPFSFGAEKVTLANSFELQYNVQFNKLKLGGAISLSSLVVNEKLSAINSYIDSSKTYNEEIWYWKYYPVTDFKYVTPHGDTILYTYYDSVYTSRIVPIHPWVSDSVSYNIESSMKYIGIPIFVGYSFPVSKKIELIPKIGINTGVLIYSRTYKIAEDKGRYVVKKTDENLNTFLFSSVFSTQVKYSFPHLSVFLEPKYTRFINSIYNDGKYYSSKYAYWSIAFGVNFKL